MPTDPVTGSVFLSGLQQRLEGAGEEFLDGLFLRTAHRQDQAVERSLGLRDLPPGIDPHDLEQTGWAVLFAPSVEDDARFHLRDLLEKRRDQAGSRFVDIVLDVDPETETLGREFLWRLRGESPGVIDLDALPYYVLLVGSPTEVPFHFQADLGIDRAVGRLDFRDVEELGHYADAVLAAESAYDSPDFHALHMSSETDLVTQQVAETLQRHVVEAPKVEKAWPWERRKVADQPAEELAKLLAEASPGLLAVSGHGRSVSFGKLDQRDRQGALVLSGSRADGSPSELRGEDIERIWPLGEQPFIGSIAAFFICHGLGLPLLDDFPFRDRRRPGNTWAKAEPAVLTREPFTARLPQVLLARGALAFFGHVERGFTSSFLWRYGPYENPATRSLSAAFENLSCGHRLGHALRPIFKRASSIASHLLPMLEAVRNGWEVDEASLREQWVSYVDARNYMLLGDPAVYAGGVPGVPEGQEEVESEVVGTTAASIFLPEVLLSRLRERFGSEGAADWIETQLTEALVREAT